MGPISESSASGHVVEGPDATRMETRSTSNAHAKHWEMTLTEGQRQPAIAAGLEGEVGDVWPCRFGGRAS
jgi:hypothetical protein